MSSFRRKAIEPISIDIDVDDDAETDYAPTTTTARMKATTCLSASSDNCKQHSLEKQTRRGQQQGASRLRVTRGIKTKGDACRSKSLTSYFSNTQTSSTDLFVQLSHSQTAPTQHAQTQTASTRKTFTKQSQISTFFRSSSNSSISSKPSFYNAFSQSYTSLAISPSQSPCIDLTLDEVVIGVTASDEVKELSSDNVATTNTPPITDSEKTELDEDPVDVEKAEVDSSVETSDEEGIILGWQLEEKLAAASVLHPTRTKRKRAHLEDNIFDEIKEKPDIDSRDVDAPSHISDSEEEPLNKKHKLDEDRPKQNMKANSTALQGANAVPDDDLIVFH